MQWISMFENGFTLPGSDVQILTLFRPMVFSIKLYMYNNVRMSKRSRLKKFYVIFECLEKILHVMRIICQKPID